MAHLTEISTLATTLLTPVMPANGALPKASLAKELVANFALSLAGEPEQDHRTAALALVENRADPEHHLTYGWPRNVFRERREAIAEALVRCWRDATVEVGAGETRKRRVS